MLRGSQCKSLIELSVNYLLPGHVNACAKGFFFKKKKKNLLYNLKPYTLPSPGPDCSPGCFHLGEQGCEMWMDPAGESRPGRRSRVSGRSRDSGSSWDSARNKFCLDCGLGRSHGEQAGRAALAQAACGPQRVTSQSCRAQLSPFPGTVASGVIFRPAFRFFLCCFFLDFFFFPCSSPLLSAALEALGREENTDPQGRKLHRRALGASPSPGPAELSCGQPFGTAGRPPPSHPKQALSSAATGSSRCNIQPCFHPTRTTPPPPPHLRFPELF